MGSGNPIDQVTSGISNIGGDIFGGVTDLFSGGLGFDPLGRLAQGALGGGAYDAARGATEGKQPQTDTTLQEISKALYAETDPLRRAMLERSGAFVGGNLDVTQSPQYAALKRGAESQYDRARQNIISTTPTGGALTRALAQNEYAKAGALTQGAGNIASQEQQIAYGLATGTPLSTSFGGLGSAAALQGQQAQAQAQQNAAAKGALGTGAGALLGSKGGAAATAAPAVAAGG